MALTLLNALFGILRTRFVLKITFGYMFHIVPMQKQHIEKHDDNLFTV